MFVEKSEAVVLAHLYGALQAVANEYTAAATAARV
jgi:hypothetical protein